ncbi:MAG: N-acetylmuramoyl-L-alanine amidase [Pseudomonadota bacterium]
MFHGLKIRVFPLWLCLFLAPMASAAVELETMRIVQSPSHTQLVVQLSGPVKHSLFDLDRPARVVLDLERTRLEAPTVPPAAGFIKKVRTGKPDKQTLRVVLDLTESVKMRSFQRTPEEGNRHELVVELYSGATREPVKTAAQSTHGRDVIVAIDPGHGGIDPGALGKKGTREKDVVLAISRRLQKAISKHPGFKAVLIRDKDEFLRHRDRMRIAREKRADLFVSIHADAFKDARAHGSTVYVLSERGASSEAARWLAERENAADLMGGVSLGDKDDVLASVLLDLSQTATLDMSIEAGNHVVKELGKVGRVRRVKVQHAGFLVLKSPDIPSILVETAFISNPNEERRLRQAESQQAWADAITDGVVKYFHANPPTGTLVAERQRLDRPQEIAYTIARGDTLSGIADRFNVRLRSLRKVNNIRGDRIRVGQVIRIPGSS